MNQDTLPFDVCSSRHKQNDLSVAANELIGPHKTRDRDAIHALICEAGWQGLTSAEIEQKTGRAKNSFSGRLTELKMLGRIRAVGRRGHCAIFVAS